MNLPKLITCKRKEPKLGGPAHSIPTSPPLEPDEAVVLCPLRMADHPGARRPCTADPLGVRETFRNANNNVSQWLPQDYEETRTYQEFRRLFGSDDSAVVSWDGCTLDDDRLEKLAGYLVPPPEERRPGDGSEWFEKVITGQQVLKDLMTGPAQLSRAAALRRLEGTLVGPDLETTCVVVILSEKGDADRTGALAALEEIAESRCGLRRDQLRLGGDAVINAAIDIESKQAIRKWVGLAWGLAIAFAWLSLRRARLMVMVFVVSFYAAILGTGMVHYTGGTMNLLLVLVPVLLFVLTISASVHLCNYYRDAIREFGIVGAPCAPWAAAGRPARSPRPRRPWGWRRFW